MKGLLIIKSTKVNSPHEAQRKQQAKSACSWQKQNQNCKGCILLPWKHKKMKGHYRKTKIIMTSKHILIGIK